MTFDFIGEQTVKNESYSFRSWFIGDSPMVRLVQKTSGDTRKFSFKQFKFRWTSNKKKEIFSLNFLKQELIKYFLNVFDESSHPPEDFKSLKTQQFHGSFSIVTKLQFNLWIQLCIYFILKCPGTLKLLNQRFSVTFEIQMTFNAKDFNAVPKKFFPRKMLIQDDSSCSVLLLCTFIEISKSVNVKIIKILEIS